MNRRDVLDGLFVVLANVLVFVGYLSLMGAFSWVVCVDIQPNHPSCHL